MRVRLEQIEQEAKSFDRENEAYIHLERATGAPYKLILTGDYKAVMQGIYNILCLVSQEYNMKFTDILKQMKKAYKANGIRQPEET